MIQRDCTPETKLPAPGVGELTALLPSWRLHLEASNLSPRTIRAYTDDRALPAAFLATLDMPTAVLSIRPEHGEALIVAELERTSPSSAATRYRSLRQLFTWLDDEGEIQGSPMAKMRPPKIPEKPVPVPSINGVATGTQVKRCASGTTCTVLQPQVPCGRHFVAFVGRYTATALPPPDPQANSMEIQGWPCIN